LKKLAVKQIHLIQHLKKLEGYKTKTENSRLDFPKPPVPDAATPNVEEVINALLWDSSVHPAPNQTTLRKSADQSASTRKKLQNESQVQKTVTHQKFQAE